MRDRSDRYQVQSMSTSANKKIGGYLVDAGLLTAAQISVALNDQKSTGMRFGEIVVARGWLKEQTIEWIMNKVVEPERRAVNRHQQPANASRWSGQVVQPLAQTTAPIGAEPIGARPRQSVASIADTKPNGVAKPTAHPTTDKPANPKFARREAPISKPLPSVNSSDGDVNWVG